MQQLTVLQHRTSIPLNHRARGLSLAVLMVAGSALAPSLASAQDVCPGAIGANATVESSRVDCTSRVGSGSIVYASTLAGATLGTGAQVVGASVGDLGLEVTLGAGSNVLPGARATAAQFGARALIDRGARIRGGRGIDFIRIGDDASIGAGTDLRLRSAGNGAVIGANSVIGESTIAGNDFRFGADSVWTVGGEVGNGVTVGDRARIEGGFSAGNGVVVGDDVSISFRVSVGANAQIYRGASIENNATVGARALIGRAVVIGTGATVDERVLVKSNARIGDNSRIGAGSIVEVGARVPVGTNVPPNSRVAGDGTITPL